MHLYRSDGSDPGRIERVRLNLSSALGGAAGDQLDAEPQGEGIFTASVIFASFSRTWDVTVDVRREGFDDTRTGFIVPMEGRTAGSAGGGIFGSPAPQLDRNVVWALLLVMAGVAALLSIGRDRSARGQSVRWAGAGAIFVAGVLTVSAEQHLHGGAALTNPGAGAPASVARGAPLFAANCATCHGVTGRGDGPAAAALTPPPADLQLHIPQHSDGDTFSFISAGLAGTAMPAWGDRLTEQQIWDLVNYLRSEFDPAGRALPAP